jgi:NAD(P) transhydrogenase subunit beta
MMTQNLVSATYLGSAVLFVLSLLGLNHPSSARQGNIYGMIGMALALAATLWAAEVSTWILILAPLSLGAVVGLWASKSVKTTQLPELVALMHSLVGLAAVLVGLASFLDITKNLHGSEKLIHDVEVYIGILIGTVTFSGSLVAFGKLLGVLSGAPLLLPARHWLNLILVLCLVGLGFKFVSASHEPALLLLFATIVVSFFLGIHMVMAIGGADMPVVVSMLNSYSGWAASATGFMLNNHLLIIVGALVGSSGAILSSIMCKAMNRKFLNVIAGGFGSQGQKPPKGSSSEPLGEITAINAQDVSELLSEAKSVVVVPGYGMAVAQAQHTVCEISQVLSQKGVLVRYAIHPVAGRMPGHMNVLLAEARVPYDQVFEMEEINDDLKNVDVTIVIGANDIVNPSALEDPASPIAGMPVLEVWKSKISIVIKRGMASGYAGVENPLFYKENNRMLFGDAKAKLDEILQFLKIGSD